MDNNNEICNAEFNEVQGDVHVPVGRCVGNVDDDVAALCQESSLDQISDGYNSDMCDDDDIDYCAIADNIESEVSGVLKGLCKKIRDESYEEGLVVGSAMTKKSIYEKGYLFDGIPFENVQPAEICRDCRFWTLGDGDARNITETALCRFLDTCTNRYFRCRYGIKISDD